MAMSQTDEHDTHAESPAPGPRRRGFFVAAAALVAGLVAKVTEPRVEARVDYVVLGAANTTAIRTSVTTSSADGEGLRGSCTGGTDGIGLHGLGSGHGVYGRHLGSTPLMDAAGVVGVTGEATGYGVLGFTSSAGAPAVAVHGRSSASPKGIGVLGQGRGAGVFGQITPGSSVSGIAVYGLNNSSYAGPGPGAGGFGVYGLSANGHGVVGATAAAGAAAVVGATNGVSGAYAAAFYGPIIVSGAFTVIGGPKSAAVPHPDGTLRRLYCVESPESWFEDFGEATLDCGTAEIAIDPMFAAVADLSAYHVFLTGYDDFELRVAERKPAAFRVRARDQASAGRFSWRIVAKRKDITGPRFEAVTVPPEPTLPPVPDFPTPPPPPDVPNGA